jgi:putative FmdB family regulatory protein
VPRYQYECVECRETLNIFHLSNEKMTDCPTCLKEGALKKLLTTFRSSNKKVTTRKQVGDITEEFIETSRHDLQKQKQDLKNIK